MPYDYGTCVFLRKCFPEQFLSVHCNLNFCFYLLTRNTEKKTHFLNKLWHKIIPNFLVYTKGVAKEQTCKSITSFWERQLKKAFPLTSDSSSILYSRFRASLFYINKIQQDATKCSIIPKSKHFTIRVKVYIYIVFLYVWESLSFGQSRNRNYFPHRNKKFLSFPDVTRHALELTQSPTNRYGGSSPTDTEADREPNHSPLFSPVIEHVYKWSYSSSLPRDFIVWTGKYPPLPQPYPTFRAHIQCV